MPLLAGVVLASPPQAGTPQAPGTLGGGAGGAKFQPLAMTLGGSVWAPQAGVPVAVDALYGLVAVCTPPPNPHPYLPQPSQDWELGLN